MVSDGLVIQWDLGINGMGKMECKLWQNAEGFIVSEQMGSICNAFSVRSCDENVMCSLCIEHGEFLQGGD